MPWSGSGHRSLDATNCALSAAIVLNVFGSPGALIAAIVLTVFFRFSRSLPFFFNQCYHGDDEDYGALLQAQPVGMQVQAVPVQTVLAPVQAVLVQAVLTPMQAVPVQTPTVEAGAVL